MENTCQSYVEFDCLSSCSLASSCWGNFLYNNSYIVCSWNASEHIFQSISVSDGSNQCIPDVICFDDFLCESFVFSNNSFCNFVLLAKSVVFSITLKKGAKNCTVMGKFNPCHIIKLEPPVIKKIVVQTNLQVFVNKPSCLHKSWTSVKYQLAYSVYNGAAFVVTAEKDELQQPPFLLPLYEACQYSFYLKIVSNEVPDLLKVWSEPYHDTYLTGPTNAVDNDFISFQCAQKKGVSFLTAIWKKSGIIDVFNCELYNLLNGNSTHLSVSGKSPDGTFEAQFSGLHFSWSNYMLKVIAKNAFGSSKSTNFSVDCDLSGKKAINCHVSSNAKDMMTITWQKPLFSSSYDGFQLISNSTSGLYMSKKLPTSATYFTLSDLQICVLYHVEVFSMFGSSKVGSCSVNSYSVETVPRQSPLFTLLTVSETYILINVSNLHANQSCGEIDFNIIFLKNFTYSLHIKGFSLFNISGLQPYSYYNVSVAAINNAGHGPYSKPFLVQTAEAAPSDLPNIFVHKNKQQYFISWTRPKCLNGILFNYWMFIFHSIKSENQEKYPYTCNSSNNITKCFFSANEQNVSLKLNVGDFVSMNACTDNGKKCSSKTSSILITFTTSGLQFFQYCIIFATLLLFLIGFGFCIYVARSTRNKIRGPIIHPIVLADFSRLPLNYETATESPVNENCDIYNFISEWRENDASSCTSF